MRFSPWPLLFLCSCLSQANDRFVSSEIPLWRGEHHLERFEDLAGIETPVARAPGSCRELVPSWNLTTAPDQPVLVDVAVGDAQGEWSPWMFIGSWGESGRVTEQVMESPWGKVDVDTFLATRPFDRARLRLRTTDGEAFRGQWSRASFCFSREPGLGRPGARPRGELELEVPYRSQRWEAEELAPRVCSPTSIAMVMQYHGRQIATAEVAARAYDANHDLYGNWSRAVQCAFSYGFPGYVTRFSDWKSVEAHLASGRPLVVSIRVEEGELTGAPFRSSAGHLLVLRGIAADGRILVNDPAFPQGDQGRTAYRADELEQVWFERRRGTAYVIEAP